MKNTPKMKAAQRLINRRFHGGVGKLCVALLDIVRFWSMVNPTRALMGLPNFKSQRSYRVSEPEKERYARAHWFRSKTSTMKFCIHSEPLDYWLAPYRLTLYADDQSGLLPTELFSILEVMPKATLLMVELAFDFSPLTGVTGEFVRRYGIFGKAHRDRKTKNRSGMWWGAKKGGKRIKSYFKEPVFGHRVEFRMGMRFLKARGVETVFDFWKFEQALPKKYIWFARLDQRRMMRQLALHHTVEEALRFLRLVNAKDGDLEAQMTILRRDAGLENTRRLVVPLRTNQLVREALRDWAKAWPKTPARLGKRP
jgi:hypothetical protein